MDTVKVIGIGALLILLAQKAGAAVANRLKIGQIRFKIDGLDLQGLKVRLFLPIKNNTPVPLPFDSFAGVLSYGPYNLAQVTINERTVLESGKEITTEVRIVAPYSNIVGTVADIVYTKQFLQGLYIKGNLVSNNVVIPINQNIQVL